jgi:2-keto-myo-inositol isomerase
MHERFCLNAATIKTTPLDRQIDLAHGAGFRQIGLWQKDVEAAVAAGKSLTDIKAKLDDLGLTVAEFCFLGGWMDADDAKLKETLAQAHCLCKMTQALGCKILVTVPALKPGWLPGAPDRFRQVCQVAAEYSLRVALEFPGIAADVHDLRAARDLVSAAGCANGGLIIDTFHFFLGGSKVEDFNRMAPGEIFLVHVSDAMKLPMETLRIPHDNRTFPGEGTIDYAPIIQQLRRLQYDGAISLEIWNSELHKSDPEAAVKRGAESLRHLEGLL